MNRVFVSGYRFAIVSACILVSFSVLLGRLYFLHVVKQDELSSIVEQNRKRFQVIEARRGNVVDAQGNLLATTQGVRELGVDPQMVEDVSHEQLFELAGYLGVSIDWLRGRIEQKQFSNGKDIRWRKLADAVSEKDYKKILEIGIKGVYGNRKFFRLYPGDALASHVIGYTNKENNAVMGIEQSYNFYLQGQQGWRESEKDGNRRERAEFTTRNVEPVDGYHVELSLDMTMQLMVEKEVQRLVDEFQPQGVSIIVSEPSTGYILALANAPTFDLNAFWEYPIDSHRNRALTDIYEPGSTFKIVAASAVLNEHKAEITDTFDCNLPVMMHRGRSLKLPGDHHPLGTITLEQIVVKSSNRGAAQLGMLLGEDTLYDYTRRFGFGKKSNIGFRGEVNGLLHPVKAWDGLTITRLPMGHAIGVTPIQVHQSMSVIANGGVLMRPQLVTRVFDDANEPVHFFSPSPIRRVISLPTADALASMLKKVVGDEGTARRAFVKGYGVAGKTGTTQKIVEGRYSSQHHVASFAGFFPADHPRIVMTVVVDEPQLEGNGYGGRVAAPAFKNLATQFIQYLGVAPETPKENFVVYQPDGALR